MTLHISITPDTEAGLRERAAAVGQDIATYAAGVLARAAQRPVSIAEISGPVGRRFDASGMTEDQLTEELERAKHEARAKRRAS